MGGRHRMWVGIGLSAVVAAFLAGVVSAEIPRKINYQGRLTDSVTGLPLAGSHTLVLRIYDAPSYGSLLWAETTGIDADSTGVFAAVLGSIEPLAVAFDIPCWLEVEADGEILSPRREMVSVPYAFTADIAGEYEIFCTHFCGPLHLEMRAAFFVDDPKKGPSNLGVGDYEHAQTLPGLLEEGQLTVAERVKGL